MTNRHTRPVTNYEQAAYIIRTGLDALTTGQADTRGEAVRTLDRALWDLLEQAPQEELDRC